MDLEKKGEAAGTKRKRDDEGSGYSGGPAVPVRVSAPSALQLQPEPSADPGISAVGIPSTLLARGIDVDVSMQNMEDKEKRWSWTTGTIAAIKKHTDKETEILLHIPVYKTRVWLPVTSTRLAPKGMYQVGLHAEEQVPISLGDTPPAFKFGSSSSSSSSSSIGGGVIGDGSGLKKQPTATHDKDGDAEMSSNS